MRNGVPFIMTALVAVLAGGCPKRTAGNEEATKERAGLVEKNESKKIGSETVLYPMACEISEETSSGKKTKVLERTISVGNDGLLTVRENNRITTDLPSD